MMKNIYLLQLLVTTTIVISQDSANNEVALILNHVEPKLNVTCLCIDDGICAGNSQTCTLQNAEQSCYMSWRLDLSGTTINLNAGCLYNNFFFTQLFCNGNDTKNYVACCSDRDYCNDLDAYSKSIRKALLNSPTTDVSKPDKRYLWIIIISLISFITVIFVVFLAFLYARKRRSRRNSRPYLDPTPKTVLQTFRDCFRTPKNEQNAMNQSLRSLLDEMSTSTMGSTLPLLIQRTLARQITIEKVVGSGRYGSVYRGKWRADQVAVKIFSANDERSWFREIEIYQTNCLRHENILGFIAADNMDASTHTQLWLVTEYHENGSLYDYLTNNTVTLPVLLKMMATIASGLCHLHMPIDSTNGKVALAHRDLKTKNILVKRDLTCCIADLGLAVREVRITPHSREVLANSIQSDKEHYVIDIQPNPRVGTIRYMAPEVLSGKMNMKSFESFKSADIYSLGLVYWEMIRRCRLNPKEDDTEAFEVTYEDVAPNNPTFEQMRDIVCTRHIRPSASPRWEKHPVLRQLLRVCEELWIEEPSCRLNSLHIKTQLKTLSESIEQELSNTNSDSQQLSTQNEGPWTT